MSESNLNILLKTMNPIVVSGKYYFASVDPNQIMVLANYLDYITAIFREEEGLTIVFLEDIKDDISQLTEQVSGPFALITCGVTSDLLAVGFLAKLTATLAKKQISVNAYSAYYHDHLFVPYEMKENALAALASLSQFK